MDTRICQWPLADIGDRRPQRKNRRQDLLGVLRTSLALRAVQPELAAGRRLGSSLFVLKFTTHLLPRNGGARISEMLGKTPIDFRKLFRCERKLLFSLRIIKALPKSDGQCRPVLGGEFQ